MPVAQKSLAKKEIAVAPRAKPATDGGRVAKILAIITEEVGVSLDELTDASTFADLGLDSLLSLTICGRFREELDLEVESSIFLEHPTVKDLKALFLEPIVRPPSPEVESSQTSDSEVFSPDEDASGSSSASSIGDDDDVDVMASVKKVLAEEIGLKHDELDENADLLDLGLDSLMSLKVLGELRESMSIDLSSDFFMEYNSLRKIREHLGIRPKTDTVVPITEPTTVSVTERPVVGHRPASSVLLQGKAATATKTLWLFPDGSGSATSYVTIPKVGDDVVVYGLNCPYMKTPHELVCGVDGLTVSYLQELRRRQPHGPYYLGGWSAGGISALDAAQVLQKEGEKVERLILIDSPFPIGLEKLPPHLYDFFKSAKLFGEKEPPSWLLPHFLAFVDALDKYKTMAKPFAPGTAPQTHIIWARDGVCKDPKTPRPERRADDPREMWWLLENRTDFGPNKWNELVGDDIVIQTMDDANHFNMMEGPKGTELAGFLTRAMS